MEYAILLDSLYCSVGGIRMSNSVYPSWWDKTVTVYNKHVDAATDEVTWTHVQVPNCFWKSVHTKVAVGQTIVEGNQLICRVPQSSLYKSNYEWSQLPSEDRGKYFTIDVGDIVVNAPTTDDIDEYANGKRSSDLISKYKAMYGCMEISEFAINVSREMLQPHYRIVGD